MSCAWTDGLLLNFITLDDQLTFKPTQKKGASSPAGSDDSTLENEQTPKMNKDSSSRTSSKKRKSEGEFRVDRFSLIEVWRLDDQLTILDPSKKAKRDSSDQPDGKLYAE